MGNAKWFQVISNNMNAGTAWCNMGVTLRLAQTLGLHEICPPSISPDAKFLRARVWCVSTWFILGGLNMLTTARWTVMWQDSLLSITYDRASSTALMDHSGVAMPGADFDLPPYHSSMMRICKVGLDIVKDRSRAMSSRELFARITKHRDEIQIIMRDSADYLREPRKCRSPRESLEHWALYLHSSYILSELCRPAISPRTADPELAKHFKQLCLDSLVNTVEAFLGLQNITPFARQSWASVHRSLSSALLLGIMGEHAQNERCRRILGRFVALMSDITSSVDPTELAAPIERAVSALRKLNIREAPPPPPPPPPSVQRRPNAPPRFIEDIALSGSMGTMDGVESKFDHSSIYGPNIDALSASGGDGLESGEEYSPYTVLNSILWGNKSTP